MIEFTKEEIQIRIESLKENLNEIQKELNSQLDNIKIDLLTYFLVKIV